MYKITDDDILKMYKKGYSTKYISKLLYKSLNKNNKPIQLNGVFLFPAKIYKMDYCKTHVAEAIYNNMVRDCLSRMSG